MGKRESGPLSYSRSSIDFLISVCPLYYLGTMASDVGKDLYENERWWLYGQKDRNINKSFLFERRAMDRTLVLSCNGPHLFGCECRGAQFKLTE